VNREVKSSLISFCIELLIYAVLVVAYYFLVLHLLGDWLQRLFDHDRRLYAVTALGLIICQGLMLEVLTRLMLAFIKPRTEAE
jgi:hypothetical protein